MKFSVIVPFFNEAFSVREDCRRSIDVAISSAGVDVEVIEEFGGDGVSAARNRGIAKSTGDWLLFVDADDIVEKEYFAQIANAIKRNPSAQVIAWGECRGASLWSGLWDKAYRRDILPAGGFRPYSHGEDRLFVTAVLSRNPIVETIPLKLYIYRPSATSATSKPRDAKWILDTIGYSGEMLDMLDGMAFYVDRLYHDIAVWILEECAHAMRKIPARDRNGILRDWRDMCRRIGGNRRFPVWNRFVANASVRGGTPARVLFCCVPRFAKRLAARIVYGSGESR